MIKHTFFFSCSAVYGGPNNTRNAVTINGRPFFRKILPPLPLSHLSLGNKSPSYFIKGKRGAYIETHRSRAINYAVGLD